MRRWLWPYAILTVIIVVIAVAVLSSIVSGVGVDRAGGEMSATYAKVVEPGVRFMTSLVNVIAPFDLPVWVKELYATLMLIAVVGTVLALGVGILLVPVFYALYRSRMRD